MLSHQRSYNLIHDGPQIKLRFCPDCMKATRKRRIEPYWRRSHQIFSVDVCHQHERALMAFARKQRSGEPCSRFRTPQNAGSQSHQGVLALRLGMQSWAITCSILRLLLQLNFGSIYVKLCRRTDH